MNSIVTSVIILSVLGILCALLLVIAAKYMHVPVDEKFPAIRECLPGANCGACGYAGCDGYADALASGEEEATNKCVPGASETATRLAEVMGTEASVAQKKAAVVHCNGNCDVTQKAFDFQGTRSCAASVLSFGGEGVCAYGCVGHGDCAAACPEQAINIINGVAHVNTLRCTGCGMCTTVCPKHLISVHPVDIVVGIACSNQDKGRGVVEKCANGCIGCGLCSKKCPEGAITMVNNLPVYDYDKCTGCGICHQVCPGKCIFWSGKMDESTEEEA